MTTTTHCEYRRTVLTLQDQFTKQLLLHIRELQKHVPPACMSSERNIHGSNVNYFLAPKNNLKKKNVILHIDQIQSVLVQHLHKFETKTQITKVSIHVHVYVYHPSIEREMGSLLLKNLPPRYGTVSANHCGFYSRGATSMPPHQLNISYFVSKDIISSQKMS